MAGVRTVQCYLCHRHFDVPLRAMSLSCPWCYQRVTLDDITIKSECYAKSMRTCGRIVVQKRGRLCASYIEGRMGVEVLGQIEGPVRCGTRLFVGSTGSIVGDVAAPSIQVEPGGRVDSRVMRLGEGADPVPESSVRRVPAGLNNTEAVTAPAAPPTPGVIVPSRRAPRTSAR